MRLLVRTSLAALGLVLAYWTVAGGYGLNFRALDGSEGFRSVPVTFGRTGLAWIVEQRNVMVWIVRDDTCRALQVIRRRQVTQALFDTNIWNQTFEARPIRWLPGAGRLNFAGAWPDGNVRATLIFVPLWWFVGLFGALPAFVWRVARVRRSRAGLGRCACGYDLRLNESRRCPECGRAIRWIPVPWPVVPRSAA
jgi:hypothetical protein